MDNEVQLRIIRVMCKKGPDRFNSVRAFFHSRAAK
jgi:hypothetical protein